MRYARSLLLLTAVIAVGSMLGTAQTAQAVTTIKIAEDQVALQFVGQFNNSGTSSQQFGYLSDIQGFSPVFNGTPQDERTANFTFVTNATTNVVFVNGPFKTINRTGTTTIYLNNGPSDFTNPTTFSQGTPVQVSTYSQQVVLNTVTGSFTTVHMNLITQTEPFALGGATYRLGQVGKSFRTTYSGQINAIAGTSPGGWFSGYAVGVK
jgi:hypothetical protein